MHFKFLGYGDAFNVKRGNTSAYYKEGSSLFLIDCGETVFSSLIENKVLDGVKDIYIFITHTHADHIGSIGTLIMYNYFKSHIKNHIILSKDIEHKTNIDLIVRAFGCLDEMFDYVYEDELDNKFSAFERVYYVKTTHYETLNCYSIIFEHNNKVTYYSGDTNELDTLLNLIDANDVDIVYIDTTSADYEGNVHMNINLLNEKIPESIRDKVYCMHVNDDECERLIHEYGFNLIGE